MTKVTTSRYIYRLDEILKARQMNPHQLSVMAGIHYNTALRIYYNKTNAVSLDVLTKICNVLEITPGDLFKQKK
jgi:DNA-binding Xre family transcriptional regulator